MVERIVWGSDIGVVTVGVTASLTWPGRLSEEVESVQSPD
jgi:hypothetical protein